MGSRGCGVGYWHGVYSTCCYPPGFEPSFYDDDDDDDDDGAVVLIVVGSLAAVIGIIAGVACCATDCCKNKTSVAPNAVAPVTGTAQAMAVAPGTSDGPAVA